MEPPFSLKTVLFPTHVAAVETGSFTSPRLAGTTDAPEAILLRGRTHLELLQQGVSTSRSIQNCHGRVCSLAALRGRPGQQDRLLLTTEAGFLSVSTYHPELQRFVPSQLLRISAGGPPELRLGALTVSHCEGTAVAVAAQSGRITVFRARPDGSLIDDCLVLEHLPLPSVRGGAGGFDMDDELPPAALGEPLGVIHDVCFIRTSSTTHERSDATSLTLGLLHAPPRAPLILTFLECTWPTPSTHAPAFCSLLRQHHLSGPGFRHIGTPTRLAAHLHLPDHLVVIGTAGVAVEPVRSRPRRSAEPGHDIWLGLPDLRPASPLGNDVGTGPASCSYPEGSFARLFQSVDGAVRSHGGGGGGGASRAQVGSPFSARPPPPGQASTPGGGSPAVAAGALSPLGGSGTSSSPGLACLEVPPTEAALHPPPSRERASIEFAPRCWTWIRGRDVPASGRFEAPVHRLVLMMALANGSLVAVHIACPSQAPVEEQTMLAPFAVATVTGLEALAGAYAAPTTLWSLPLPADKSAPLVSGALCLYSATAGRQELRFTLSYEPPSGAGPGATATANLNPFAALAGFQSLESMRAQALGRLFLSIDPARALVSASPSVAALGNWTTTASAASEQLSSGLSEITGPCQDLLILPPPDRVDARFDRRVVVACGHGVSGCLKLGSLAGRVDTLATSEEGFPALVSLAAFPFATAGPRGPRTCHQALILMGFADDTRVHVLTYRRAHGEVSDISWADVSDACGPALPAEPTVACRALRSEATGAELLCQVGPSGVRLLSTDERRWTSFSGASTSTNRGVVAALSTAELGQMDEFPREEDGGEPDRITYASIASSGHVALAFSKSTVVHVLGLTGGPGPVLRPQMQLDLAETPGTGEVTALAISPGGRQLLIAHRGGYADLYKFKANADGIFLERRVILSEFALSPMIRGGLRSVADRPVDCLAESAVFLGEGHVALGLRNGVLVRAACIASDLIEDCQVDTMGIRPVRLFPSDKGAWVAASDRAFLLRDPLRPPTPLSMPSTPLSLTHLADGLTLSLGDDGRIRFEDVTRCEQPSLATVIPLDATPKKVVQHPTTGLLVVLCGAQDGALDGLHSVRLVDPATAAVVHVLELQEGEVATSLCCWYPRGGSEAAAAGAEALDPLPRPAGTQSPSSRDVDADYSTAPRAAGHPGREGAAAGGGAGGDAASSHPRGSSAWIGRRGRVRLGTLEPTPAPGIAPGECFVVVGTARAPGGHREGILGAREAPTHEQGRLLLLRLGARRLPSATGLGARPRSVGQILPYLQLSGQTHAATAVGLGLGVVPSSFAPSQLLSDLAPPPLDLHVQFSGDELAAVHSPAAAGKTAAFLEIALQTRMTRAVGAVQGAHQAPGLLMASVGNRLTAFHLQLRPRLRLLKRACIYTLYTATDVSVSEAGSAPILALSSPRGGVMVVQYHADLQKFDVLRYDAFAPPSLSVAALAEECVASGDGQGCVRVLIPDRTVGDLPWTLMRRSGLWTDQSVDHAISKLSLFMTRCEARDDDTFSGPGPLGAARGIASIMPQAGPMADVAPQICPPPPIESDLSALGTARLDGPVVVCRRGCLAPEVPEDSGLLLATASGHVAGLAPLTWDLFWDAKALEHAAATHPAFLGLSGLTAAKFAAGPLPEQQAADPTRVRFGLGEEMALDRTLAASALVVQGDLIAEVLRAQGSALFEDLLETAVQRLAGGAMARAELLGIHSRSGERWGPVGIGRGSGGRTWEFAEDVDSEWDMGSECPPRNSDSVFTHNNAKARILRSAQLLGTLLK